MSRIHRACGSALACVAMIMAAGVAFAEPVVRVSGELDLIPLVPRTVVIDPDGSLTPVEAERQLTAAGAVVETKAFSHGYIPDVLWSRIVLDVTADAAGPWYLSLELPNFDRLQVFTVPIEGRAPVPLVALGDHAPRATDIPSRFHIAPIDLQAGRLVLLVRGQTGSTMTVDLKLRKLEALQAQEQGFFALQAFYLGISAVLGLAAAGLLLYTRQIIYVIYLINLVAQSGLWLIINGTGPGHLWPELAQRYPVDHHALVALTIFATATFSAIFLSTKRVPLLVRRSLWAIAAVSLVLAVLCALVTESDVYWSSALISVLVAPAAGAMLVLTSIGLFAGEPAARPLMLTWIAAAGAVALAVMRDLGIVPNNVVTLTGPQLGSVVEMIIFAYMLVDRLGRVQREKELLQQEALNAARENEELQRQALIAAHEHEAVLERRVSERTAELDAAVVREREARRLQQQFVAMVSHEFRTPLAIVDATTQNFATEDTGDHTRLDKIRAAIRRLRRMIDTCLVDERVQGGRLQLQLEDVELCEIVEDTVDMLQAASVDHQFDLNLPDGPVTARADLRLMVVVISNVMENAVKYSPAGSTVGVSVSEPTGGIEIAVTDEGKGVAEADRDRIFDRYYRAATSAGITGAGLGLYLVRSILEAHGGSVVCQGAPAGGSRFTIRLPRGAASSSVPA